VVSFTPQLLYLWGKSHQYHWIGGWVGITDSLDAVAKRKFSGPAETLTLVIKPIA